jgi:hypothetical protein
VAEEEAEVSRLKIVYIASLVILGVLIGITVFQPMATGGEYSEVQQAQLLETEDEYTIQFDIINREGKDQHYTITVVIDDKPYTQKVLVYDGRKFTYIHHIYPDRVTSGEVSFTVYKDGEATPFEQATYYLK